MSQRLANRLEAVWYVQGHPGRWLLWPLECLYRLAYRLREIAYRIGLKRTRSVAVPVVVVGNVTVGGTGKTPCVIWLAGELRSRGYRVGCVSRGYRGRARQWPQIVDRDSDPAEVGDEPVLIAEATGCPVGVGPDRVAAAERLLAQTRLDVLVADDGLQHRALDRIFEIAVVDGERGLGNGACLPAGPLREPASRLNRVDAVVVNGGDWGEGSVFRARLEPQRVFRVTGDGERSLAEFRDTVVHAVAGIGHPERFFTMLKAAKIRIIAHSFLDHAPLTSTDLAFDDDYPILMTAKDAVKCRTFANERYWRVDVALVFRGGDGDRLLRRVLRNL